MLDGGSGLEFKRRKAAGLEVAYDLTLFSTAALRETPDAVVALHRDFIRSGCTVITTASYAVTRFYLDKIGEDRTHDSGIHPDQARLVRSPRGC